jgi:tetratricopeptide (TPR) repeat protein
MSETFDDQRTALEALIAGKDHDLAAMALFDLARLYETEGQVDIAEDAYRELVADGHPGQAPRAAFELARLFEARGETREAKAAYRYLLSGGMSEFAGPAVCGLRRLERISDVPDRASGPR